MNNKKKSLVSAIAGAALLAGTAGTFALWQDSAAFGADVIQSGVLSVEAELTWDDPEIEFFVPTDIRRGQAEVTIDLRGDNLTAHLSIAGFEVTLEEDGSDLVASAPDGFFTIRLGGLAEITSSYDFATGATNQNTWNHIIPVIVEFASYSDEEGNPIVNWENGSYDSNETLVGSNDIVLTLVQTIN